MTLHRFIVVSLLSIVMAVVPSLHADTVGTSFTYQGVLSDAGAPVAGDYDFRLFLYNADAGGGQVGSTLLVGNVTVTDGRMTLDLDFGDVFDGTALWLEIHLRETGTTTYASLLPRQRLTATPFANHAAEADTAASALWADDAGTALSAADTDQLGGQSPAYYLAWSNITGVPADLSNGDDDTLADLSCTAGEIAKWNGSAWDCGDDAGGLSSTYIVGPVGTATENGTALLAALDAIPTPTGPLYAALLKIEPGYYDLDGATLYMKPWVDIEGSGPGITRVFSDRCNTGSTNSEVIRLAEGAELRDLAVANSCSSSPGGNAVGIYNTSSEAKVRNARVLVKDGAESAWGIFNNGGTDFAVLDAEIQVGCDDLECAGIVSVSGPITIRHTQILAQGGGSGYVRGIHFHTDAVVTLSNLSLEINNGSELYGYGVLVRGGAILSIRDVTVLGGEKGIQIQDPHANLTDTVVTSDSPLFFSTSSGNGASDTFSVHLDNIRATSGTDYALQTSEDTGILSVRVRHSHLKGSPFTVGNNASDLDIGGSYLYSAVLEWNGGTTRCAANWDGTFVFFAGTCP